MFFFQVFRFFVIVWSMVTLTVIHLNVRTKIVLTSQCNGKRLLCPSHELDSKPGI